MDLPSTMESGTVPYSEMVVFSKLFSIAAIVAHPGPCSRRLRFCHKVGTTVKPIVRSGNLLPS